MHLSNDAPGQAASLRRPRRHEDDLVANHNGLFLEDSPQVCELPCRNDFTERRLNSLIPLPSTSRQEPSFTPAYCSFATVGPVHRSSHLFHLPNTSFFATHHVLPHSHLDAAPGGQPIRCFETSRSIPHFFSLPVLE